MSFFRAKVISAVCILAFLGGVGMVMEGDEAGVGLMAIALIIGALNKFIFGVRREQLNIDAFESVRDGWR